MGERGQNTRLVFGDGIRRRHKAQTSQLVKFARLQLWCAVKFIPLARGLPGVSCIEFSQDENDAREGYDRSMWQTKVKTLGRFCLAVGKTLASGTSAFWMTSSGLRLGEDLHLAVRRSKGLLSRRCDSVLIGPRLPARFKGSLISQRKSSKTPPSLVLATRDHHKYDDLRPTAFRTWIEWEWTGAHNHTSRPRWRCLSPC
jgi:hypothetical protein